MNRAQVLDFTSAFPPAASLIETVIDIDYRKHLNSFMDGVETVCIFVAAVFIVLRQKWQENDCTERLQLASLTVREWAVNAAAPAIKNATVATYQAGVNVRSFYELISSPLFITL